MNTDYRKHVDKAAQLTEESKRRHSQLGQGINHQLSSYLLAAGTLELGSISKVHAETLALSLTFLKKGESASGIFSDDFMNVVKALAKKLKVWVLPSAPSGAIEVLRHWIFLTVLIHVGLLEWAKLKAGPSRKEILFSERFRDELILRLFFETKTSETIYEEMAKALQIDSAKRPLFTGVMGLIGMTACLMGLSHKNEMNNDYFETLRLKWIECAKQVLEGVPAEDEKGIAGFLDPLYEAADRNDEEGFKALLDKALKETKIEPEAFQNELVEAKKLFMRLIEAWEASRGNKATMVHMVG